ncbi:MAG: hypothetical protein QM783_05735 [Phycisphaerales bacterium]
MRIQQICARAAVLCVFCAALSIAGGAATRADEPVLSQASNTPVEPATETWEEHARELIRRLMFKVNGTPLAAGATLKAEVLALQTQFLLFGLPRGLTADEITQIERDAVELTNCADWDPGPPFGSSYGLIVLMHDVGAAINKSAVNY